MTSRGQSIQFPPPLPSGPLIATETLKLVEFYQKEWQVVIDTQMHFNDLIIKFRTLTLTTFAALVGAALTVSKIATLTTVEMALLLAIPGVFWLTAALLDYFYYHRLLLGAVAQAAKFDSSRWLAELGMFGMTKSIQTHISPRASHSLLISYYALPLFVVLGVLLKWF
jgi:hypothetical protein